MSIQAWLITVAMFVSVVLMVILYLRYAEQWVEMRAEPGHRPGRLHRIHATLRANGVQTRLRQSGGGSAWMGLGSPGINTSLLVRKRDMSKAREVIANMEIA